MHRILHQTWLRSDGEMMDPAVSLLMSPQVRTSTGIILRASFYHLSLLV
jgi:hypothetical protein